MKKILIVTNNLHIGGVQKALLSLLWNIREKYDITLLLFHPSGVYMDEIPPEVKVVTSSGGYKYLGMPRQDAVTLKDLLVRNTYASISRLFGRKLAIALMGIGQKTVGDYDVAISYLHNSGDKNFYGGCNDFVLNHVSAKKKVAFLHCDYTLSGGNTLANNRQYACFDNIAACSQGCADTFVRANPDLKSRVNVVYNCHRFERILADAEQEPVSMMQNKINLVTVARLGKEKGVERALRVMCQLGSLKENIHYYIIGDGIQRQLLHQIVKQEGLSEYVTLCGELSNPYGYIKAADLMLIPSYSEAAPLVIGEAARLGTPILSMETSSAKEMILDTGFGWVCENSEEAMAEQLKVLLTDTSLLVQKQQEMAERCFSNAMAVEQFENCI